MLDSFFKRDFLTHKQLNALRLYKYKAMDRSFISNYILKHYWNWCVQFFPMSMAPNLITLTGLFFMVFNVLVTILFVPDLNDTTTDNHRWVYFSYAAGLWLYSTFDNVDGKQARRTGTSSPLGELFDHGCDAINCSFAAILEASALGLGHSKASVILYGMAMLGFYLSTAEEYHTGILYLGYVNAPTEGVLLSCVVFVISGMYGPSVWKLPLKEWVKRRMASALPQIVAEMPLSHVMLSIVGFLFLFTHAPACLYAMYKVCKKKGEPFLRTMLVQNLPIATYITAFYFWIMSPYSILLSHHHYILFAITTGIVFGRMATKIILAHLTQSDFPKFTVLLIPLIIGALLTNIPLFIPSLSNRPLITPKFEYLFLCGYFLFAVVAYVQWAVVVIHSFCKFLGIRCLTIPSLKKVD
ncbi:hypothetical protein BDF20DRAFT_841466 [Mycotypha africana]|uniref:uncharacterized protein n=1 Tax=Mycotypha africana TaxID=64632 RepID=UPI002301FA4A|nr:uncharacterized protein BDF20DRAFT_841466 [Mycotypha africana]KAI8990911.1 hypothetical protein BDF20DRAFT_841466 [Mycotypha africana]